MLTVTAALRSNDGFTEQKNQRSKERACRFPTNNPIFEFIQLFCGINEGRPKSKNKFGWPGEMLHALGLLH